MLVLVLVLMLVALTSENWVDMAQGHGPIIGHFDPDLMRTYQMQYGRRFVIIGLRRACIENRVKYAILRVRMSLCLCVSENQAYHRSLVFVSP